MTVVVRVQVWPSQCSASGFPLLATPTAKTRRAETAATPKSWPGRDESAGAAGSGTAAAAAGAGQAAAAVTHAACEHAAVTHAAVTHATGSRRAPRTPASPRP